MEELTMGGSFSGMCDANVDAALSVCLRLHFQDGLTEGIKALGVTLGYNGVCCDYCSCELDVFPACGDICNGKYGYSCHRFDCENTGCVSEDGCCPDDCEEFQLKKGLVVEDA